MTLRTDQVGNIRNVNLDSFVTERRSKYAFTRWQGASKATEPCRAEIQQAANQEVQRLQIALDDGRRIVIGVNKRIVSTVENQYVAIARELRLEAGTLQLVDAIWIRHPDSLPEDSRALTRIVRNSWTIGISYVEEMAPTEGQQPKPGLRRPQIGALHALAAHWTVSMGPALVVLPTGTGKTEVMIASTIVCAPERLLVLVPSDALRKQTAEKFLDLGVLRAIGATAKSIRAPIVAVLRTAPVNREAIEALRQANVVVSTVSMLHRLDDVQLSILIEQFDAIFMDEAHHIPADSWSRILRTAKQKRLVGFTATPFRLDGMRIPGKIVYEFPLRLAQRLDYFRPIRFLSVDEPDATDGDLEVARRAVQQLRDDLARGFRHILLARVSTMSRADTIFAEVYQPIAADLNPVVAHSRTKNKRTVLDSIRAGNHSIIICVDMFGEGFDLPNLKVAALHDVHKSLAITLQFIGRFVRTAGPEIGDATVVANLGTLEAREAIEDLYAEDSDWNLVIPGLSEQAIASQVELGAFIESMQADVDDDSIFDLSLLRPKTSTVFYQVERFSPRRFVNALRPTSKVRRQWFSRDGNTCVFITQSQVSIDWASVKEVTDEVWDLYVLSFLRDRKLLLINSSLSKTLHTELARAVSGRSARLVDGERMFRALSGIQRLVFQNVGLYGRGKLRFRMYTGYDISDAIAPPVLANSTKSNVFAIGYERGHRTNIGVSFKGKVWSMSSSTIPDWLGWCEHVAEKVLNPQLPTDRFLEHALVPMELAELPNTTLFVVLPPDEWLEADAIAMRIQIGVLVDVVSCLSIVGWERVDQRRVRFRIELQSGGSGTFQMTWLEQGFNVQQVDGDKAQLLGANGATLLSSHFEENFPVLLLSDGSEVRGKHLLRRHQAAALTFAVDQISVVDWTGVPIQQESKWRAGLMRAASVQGHVIDDLLVRDNVIVYDDDDTGEAADIIEIAIVEDVLQFRLYHCKFSHGQTPADRVRDLYEVCGQAVRSARLSSDPAGLLSHMEYRDQTDRRGGRATRFEKGSGREARKLRRRLNRYKTRFEVIVVQPGLSRNSVGGETAAILGSADMYIREFTGRPLTVLASA